MKKRINVSNRFAVVSLAILLGISSLTMSACSASKKDDDTKSNETTVSAENDTKQNEGENNGDASSKDTSADETSGKVASGDETVAAIDVVDPDMVPVSADKIKNGEYSVKVDSSSSMFKVTDCTLVVEDEQMTATLTMSGTAYTKLYMGTGEQAAGAAESDCILYEENESGAYTFTIPIEALDQGIDCAAYSKNKEMWYDRVLVLRADSLPIDALEESGVTTIESLALEDGTYTVEVTLSGGSGKASVESPATIKAESGKVTATIIFSSPNYDYMIVDGEKYEPVNTEGNSTFEIPVSAFDYNMPVAADTTAMSTPHEIEYTLHFDSSTIQ